MQSVTNGRAFGLATVAGLISGCLVHTTLVAFGVSAIIKANDSLFFTIKLLGALYLLYLAYIVFKSDSKVALTNDNVPKKTLWQLFKQGFIMNVLNPKVSIFFLAFLPQFADPARGSISIQMLLLGGLFILSTILAFGSIALLGGTIGQILNRSNWVQTVLNKVAGIVFLGLALKLATTER